MVLVKLCFMINRENQRDTDMINKFCELQSTQTK